MHLEGKPVGDLPELELLHEGAHHHGLAGRGPGGHAAACARALAEPEGGDRAGRERLGADKGGNHDESLGEHVFWLSSLVQRISDCDVLG